MQKRTREILAVLLLGFLALVCIVAMVNYVLIGHNWNVAASNIDDRIGKMDGYTVVLYEGTRPIDGGKTKSSNASESSSAVSSSSEEVSESKAEAEENQEAHAASGPDTTVNSTSETTSESESELEADLEVEPGDIKSVAESYRDKGANVFVLDIRDLSQYSDPFVVAKNNMRIGLFAVDTSTLRSDARADAHYLAERDVNYTIALTNDASLDRAAADKLIGAVSIIVCDDPEGEFPNDRYSGSTFCVSAPYVGEVGAVIISPSGVLSSKTVEGRQDS